MKMLTKEITTKLPKLYSQEKVEDPTVICKFFTPWSFWTWYVTEGEPVEDGEDFKFFGMVHGLDKEMGYFLLSELKSATGPFGLKIERDLHFTSRKLSEIK